MEDEASAIFGRKVDLESRKAIERSENYIRRKAILETAQPYYVAREKERVRKPGPYDSEIFFAFFAL